MPTGMFRLNIFCSVFWPKIQILHRTNEISGTNDLMQNITKNIYSEIGKLNPQVRCYRDHLSRYGKKQPFPWQILKDVACICI